MHERVKSFCSPCRNERLLVVCSACKWITRNTRMHSSRMRTACSSGRPGGLHQACPLDQAPPRSRPPWDQALPRSRPPGTRQPPGADPPRTRHPLLTESQTPVKTLPCPNFVAGGKNVSWYGTTEIHNAHFSSLNNWLKIQFNCDMCHLTMNGMSSWWPKL